MEAYSSIEKFLINIETTTIQADKDGFVIQKGDNNLGKVLDDIFSEVTKTFTQNGIAYDIPKFTALKLKLNSILIELQ